MLWVIAIGILLFLGLMFPSFGKFALIGGGVVIGLIAIIIVWAMVSSSHQQSVAKSLIPINQVELLNLTLNKSYYLYQLHGQVKNNSDYELTGLDLSVKAFDCPSLTITPECIIVGEDDNVTVGSDVPSHQIRSLDDVTYVNFDNMPPITGHFLWSYTINGTRGR